MSDSELSSLRSKIAETDKEIFDLIKKRMDLCEMVGKYKIEKNLPIKDYSVEKQIIEKAKKRAQEINLYEDLVINLYLSLIKYSVIKQDELARTEKQKMTSKGTKTLIVGGKGHMGVWLSQFFQSIDHDVTIYDPASSQLDNQNIVETNDFESSIAAADYIVLATPLSKTAAVIDKIINLVPKGLLIEICSLKSPIENALKNAIKSGLRVSSIHPMFGPSAQVLADRNIIICEGEGLETEDVTKNILETTSAKIVKIKFSAHDALMSYVLGAAHVVNICFSNLISKSGFVWQDIKAVAGTTFQEQMQISKEVIHENQDLYFEIQAMNKQSQQVMTEITNVLEKLNATIKNDRREDFKNIMEETKFFFES